MELPTIENSQPTPNSSDVEAHHDHDNLFPQLSDANGGGETDHKLSAEEVKGVLEIIASTGKFWHDWDELRSMLIFQLKQVLSEYPGAQISEDQQNCYLGETFLQLAKNLEEALVSFIEGPPFTLQRICEILLNARTIYPNLSKLALALEKNLLVTSTLTKSLDPYPPSTVQLEDASEQVEDVEPLPESSPLPPHSNPVENGGEPMTGEKDEVMSDVEAEAEAEAEAKAEADGGMTIDMETLEEIISSSETNPQSNSS